jgi:hypothetical protein
VCIAAYATVAPTNPWVNPLTPGWGLAEIDGGTTAQLAAEHHSWEEAVVTFRTWNTVEQALKKQISTVFEPIYLKIINNDIVGFSNTFSRDILEHLFISYGSITAVDLEHNFENMRKSWDPQQPVEILCKEIQDCVDYAEAGGITISEAQKLETDNAKIVLLNYSHSRNPRCAPAWTHGQIQAPREPPN